ncbi:hypothetical protein MB901379_00358 [Mycobacterium basiliense]|uniref:Uncharacterized protein n=1 Tax=Mycobacterium basiliense TaxID=2094119 RepID=A0A447G922_9MYCO|nr:ATP-binding protein [Mycobacterium basiliense]VDM86832.1 hypothetical protein MB901379_00358 [Mycobacterium basiliense]
MGIAPDRGLTIFVDELTGFAAGTGDRRIQAIAQRTAEPLGVLVHGRRGAGCSTVTRALHRAVAASGCAVTARPADADIHVYVVAEVLKPEDRTALAARHPEPAAQQPTLVILNKADLAGFGGAGPLAAAHTRCSDFSALVGLPVQPMIGVLAVTALTDLDEPSWCALRTLAAHPDGVACLDGSFEGFLAATLPVPAPIRLRLLEGLDLFGIALTIAALRQGGTRSQALALLRRVSGVDAVVANIVAAGAGVRYRRILDAVAALEALAVTDQRIAEFLRCDETVIARMTAALDAARAFGLPAEPGPARDPAQHLRRAVRWRRHSEQSSAPAGDALRACSADIARGSLRLWARAGGLPEAAESGVFP